MLSLLLSACLACWVFQNPAAAPPATGPAPSGDVSGNWAGEIKLPNSYSPIPLHCALKQAPEGVTGTAGPSAETQHPITGVERKGDTLKFKVAAGTLEYSFAFVLTGDRLEGSAISKDGEFVSEGKATLAREKTKEPRR